MSRTTGWMGVGALICLFCSNALWATNMGEIRCGRTRSSVIAIPGERDTWTFVGQAEDRVHIAARATSGSLRPQIVLYPPDGGPPEASALERVDLPLAQSGAYKIVIHDGQVTDDVPYDDTGRYDISLTCEPVLRPDLVISVAVDPNRIPIPKDASVVCTIINRGQLDALETTVRAYLSDDPNRDKQDILVGEAPVPPLEIGGTFVPKFTLGSAGCTAGHYWVIAEVNAVPDERNVSNSVASARVTILPRPCSLDISPTEGGLIVEPSEGVFAYTCGTVVGINAVPEPCYHFTRWTGTAVDSGNVFDANSPSTRVLVDGDRTLIANFARDVVSLSISSADCGVVEPNEGTQEYECGAIVPVRAVPCECYRFTHWSGTAVEANLVQELNSPDTTVIVYADGTLQANFELRRHTLTVVSTEGGSVVVPGEGEFVYDCGTRVPVRAVEEPGYRFIGWSGACVEPSEAANPEITATLLNDCALEANFARRCGLTINACTDGGHVEPSGTSEYECGASVTATAVPDDCYDFSRWSGSAVDANEQYSNPIAVQVAGTDTLCAHFTLRRFTLALSSTDGGQVSSSGEGELTYGCGTCVAIMPMPKECHRFSHWSGSAVDRGKVPNPYDPNLTLCMDDDYALKANFVRVTYALTIVPDPNGFIELDPKQGLYYCGEPVKASAVAKGYCHFSHWSGTAVDAGMVENPSTPDTIVWMYGDYTLRANFVCEQRTLDVSAAEGGSLYVTVVRDNRSTIWLGTGRYQFARGTVVTLEAAANSGYEFTKWSGMIWSKDSHLVLILDDDYELTANFKTQP